MSSLINILYPTGLNSPGPMNEKTIVIPSLLAHKTQNTNIFSRIMRIRYEKPDNNTNTNILSGIMRMRYETADNLLSRSSQFGAFQFFSSNFQPKYEDLVYTIIYTTKTIYR